MKPAAPFALLCAGVLAAGCAPASPPATPAAASPPAPVAFPDDPRPLPHFHSKRLALSVPLPAGREWAIDDHTRPELVMRHDRTRSTVVVAVLRAEALVGRNECTELARAERLLPREDLHTLNVVEDKVEITQGNYDTHVVVAIAPGSRPESPLVGYVVAVGGFLRKCYVFSFETVVDHAADEPVLSSRLAFARARILGGLELDPFATVPRAAPAP